MNNSIPQNNSDNVITSKYWIDNIDSLIVRITMALAIEHGIKPDPNAKEMTRAIIQDKLNILLPDETKIKIINLKNDIISEMKKGNNLAGTIYQLIKIMRLDNVNI